jgi:phasin family protein
MVTVTFMNSVAFEGVPPDWIRRFPALRLTVSTPAGLTICALQLNFVHRKIAGGFTVMRGLMAMVRSFEEVDAVGREFVDSGLKSFASLSQGIQAIALDAAEYARKTCEEGSAALQRFTAAKSPEAAFEIQSGYARSAYEGFVAEAARMTELYAELARDAYKLFEQTAPRSK